MQAGEVDLLGSVGHRLENGNAWFCRRRAGGIVAGPKTEIKSPYTRRKDNLWHVSQVLQCRVLVRFLHIFENKISLNRFPELQNVLTIVFSRRDLALIRKIQVESI